MRTASSPNGIEPETWALFRLLERVIVIAVRDARKGSTDAIDFLNVVRPQWRQEEKRVTTRVTKLRILAHEKTMEC